MRVGLLSSWRVPCGVYQYTARLADALAKQPDTEVVILAGRADEHRSVPEESHHEVHNVAKIGLWRDDQQYSLDAPYIGSLNLDIIHVQYQSMLFTQPHLEALRNERGWYNGQMAITYHDNCQRPDFPYEAFNLHFSHRWNVGPPQVEVIPFGIESRPPVVRSFGLGRTRDDYLRPICEARGWIYESVASHEPIHGGGQSWKSHEDLIQWLKGADAIVLWYDEVGQAGSSQAVRTALATRRPVITNNTTWFSDMPPKTKTYYQVSDLEELEDHLASLFCDSYLQANSWDLVAKRLIQHYSRQMVAQ